MSPAKPRRPAPARPAARSVFDQGPASSDDGAARLADLFSQPAPAAVPVVDTAEADRRRREAEAAEAARREAEQRARVLAEQHTAVQPPAELAVPAHASAEPEQEPEDEEEFEQITDEGGRPSLERLIAVALASVAGEEGKYQTPLEIAPRLKKATERQVMREKARGMKSTMTSVVIDAIDKAHASGALAELAAQYRGGQKYTSSLFGVVKVGTVPRGDTKRLQFIATAQQKAVLIALTEWYQVPAVVLVRLALEARFPTKRRTPRATATSAPAEERGQGAGS